MVPAMSSSRAPISSARPKAADKFRHALPDRLDAEHQMVVGARDDAHETVLAEHRHGAAVGGKGNSADLDLAAERPRLFRRQPGCDHFRIGEADGRECSACPSCACGPATISATISPCAMARCASIGSPVTSPMA